MSGGTRTGFKPIPPLYPNAHGNGRASSPLLTGSVCFPSRLVVPYFLIWTNRQTALHLSAYYILRGATQTKCCNTRCHCNNLFLGEFLLWVSGHIRSALLSTQSVTTSLPPPPPSDPPLHPELKHGSDLNVVCSLSDDLVGRWWSP